MITNMQILIFVMISSISSASAEAVISKAHQDKDNLTFNYNCSSKPDDCMQLIPASYITSSVCGLASICYWELWNYRIFKGLALDRRDYLDSYTVCDEHQTRRFACHIRSPEWERSASHCEKAQRECEEGLAAELHQDCLGLTKHENYPLHSCETSYANHTSMINLLLKAMDDSYQHDDRTALIGVAHLLPTGVKQEQDHFEAENRAADLGDWCDVGKNYVCIKVDYDKERNTCDHEQLEVLMKSCKGFIQDSG